MSGKTAKPHEVGGIEFDVDEEFMASWKALKLLRKFDSDDLDMFGKLDLSFELIEAATGVTGDDIVAACGGDGAKALDVVNLAVEIVRAITPKN